ncbi:Hypothetical predicted protein, partial [Pelobates cultripes]
NPTEQLSHKMELADVAEMFNTLTRQVTNLTQAVQELQTQARTPMSAVASNLVPIPEDTAMSCELMFDLQPNMYQTCTTLIPS